MSLVGFVLTIDGCPYDFTTGNVGSVSWASPDRPRGAQTLHYALEWPRVSWTEALKPNDGEPEYSGFSLVLHDAPADASGVGAGPAVGAAALASFLCTRRQTSLMQTLLDAALPVLVTDTTIELASVPTGAPTTDFVLWIGAEAILCSSRSGTTCTVDTDGRGYYGSRAAPHRADPVTNAPPVVYFEFPGVLRRRCVLFVVDDTGTAHRLWAGYCARSPRVTDARVELPLQSILEVERGNTLGRVACGTSLRGFDAWCISHWAQYPGNPFGISARSDYAIYPTFIAAMRPLVEQVRAGFATALGGGHAALADVRPEADTKTRIIYELSDASAYTVGVQLTGRDQQTATSQVVGSSPPRQVATLSLDTPPLLLGVFLVPSKFPLTTAFGLPSSWTPSEPIGSTAHYRATIAPLLSTPWDDGLTLDLWPAASGDVLTLNDTAVPIHGPTFRGIAHLRRGMTPLEGRPLKAIDKPVSLRLAYAVTASHWLYALRAVLNDTTYIQSASDPRDWDWDTFNAVLAATESPRTQWIVDGSQKLGDFVKGICALNGCALAPRGGKLALVPIRWALANEPVHADIDDSSQLDGTRPAWSVNDDGLVNIVHLKGQSLDLTVRDARSIETYGEARTVELDVTGLVDESPVLTNPADLGVQALSRMMSLWSGPTYFLKKRCTFVEYWNLYCGDFVTVDAWLAPDGTGGRGLAQRTALVIGREVDLKEPGEAGIEFTLLLTDTGLAYSPCVRIESVDETGTVLTVAGPGYIGGSDYARSDDPDYLYAASAASDGGTSRFTAGHAVEAIERDNDTPTTQSLGVVAVNPGARTITIDTPLDAALVTALGASGIVDLRFGSYAEIEASGTLDQKPWAWIGRASDHTIPSSTDPSQPWSP